MFDIASLSIQESTVFNLKHPVTEENLFADKAEKKPITITVASTSSRAYRVAVNAMQNRNLKRGNKKATAEQQKEEGISRLVACCITSENLVYNGAEVKSESDFHALLSDDKMSWVKAQVDEAVGNIEAFIA